MTLEEAFEIAGIQIQEYNVVKTIDPGDNLLVGPEQRYDNNADVHLRLAGTLVRFEDQVWWVVDVYNESFVLLWKADARHPEEIGVSANDRRLDISSLPLGYINYTGRPQYPLRSPWRHQRQGVHPESIQYFNPNNGQLCHHNSDKDLITAFGDMYRQDYPSIADASIAGQAISKTWAFGKTRDPKVKKLYHKQYFAGLYFVTDRLFCFEKGELTDLRHNSLQNILMKQGMTYDVKELS